MTRLHHFSRKNHFLSLFGRLWIKINFLFKSTLRYLLEIRTKITCWEINVIKKGFLFEVILSERSLMYIKKKQEPRIELRGTSALILTHLDDWQLQRPLWNLSLKKLSIRFKRLPKIPIDSSLNNKPLCQTLSKTFEISRNTTLVSRVGLQSNDEKIL